MFKQMKSADFKEYVKSIKNEPKTDWPALPTTSVLEAPKKGKVNMEISNKEKERKKEGR